MLVVATLKAQRKAQQRAQRKAQQKAQRKAQHKAQRKAQRKGVYEWRLTHEGRQYLVTDGLYFHFIQ